MAEACSLAAGGGVCGPPDPGLGSAVEATCALAVPPVVKKALPVAELAAGPLAIAPVPDIPVGGALPPLAVPASS